VKINKRGELQWQKCGRRCRQEGCAIEIPNTRMGREQRKRHRQDSREKRKEEGPRKGARIAGTGGRPFVQQPGKRQKLIDKKNGWSDQEGRSENEVRSQEGNSDRRDTDWVRCARRGRISYSGRGMFSAGGSISYRDIIVPRRRGRGSRDAHDLLCPGGREINQSPTLEWGEGKASARETENRTKCAPK